MYNPFGYEECTSWVRRALRDDAPHGGRPSRLRLWRLGRVAARAESGLAWLDPLLTEARAHYLEALYQVRPTSRRFRELVAAGIRNACETHGHDSPTTGRLRELRRLAWARSGRADESTIRQAETTATLPHGGRQAVHALLHLADLYERAGRYDAMIAVYDELADRLPRLGLPEDETITLGDIVGAIHYSHGEVVRAAGVLTRCHSPQVCRAGIGLVDDLAAHVRMARCLIGTRRYAAAEHVLLDVLAHREHLGGLRHEALYELGTALWRQKRGREAGERFGEACDLAAGSADGHVVRRYRNAYTMCLLD